MLHAGHIELPSIAVPEPATAPPPLDEPVTASHSQGLLCIPSHQRGGSVVHLMESFIVNSLSPSSIRQPHHTTTSTICMSHGRCPARTPKSLSRPTSYRATSAVMPATPDHANTIRGGLLAVPSNAGFHVLISRLIIKYSRMGVICCSIISVLIWVILELKAW